MNAERISSAMRQATLAGVLVLVLLGLGVGSLVQETGCTQTAHYALVRALADGTSVIDPYHEETCDKSYTDGHYYAAKAPGIAFLALPPYLALDALGLVPENDRTAIWLLGLLAALLPALLLAVVCGRLARRVEPASALPAATSVVVATLTLPFATLLFGHVLAALLGAAAFAVLWRRRLHVAAAAGAGVLAGLAVVVEHPVAIAAAILSGYALVRGGPRALGGYVAGGLVGVAPLLAYNFWSFGSITHLAVTDAVIVAGNSGHDVVGAVDEGFFGAVAPSTHVALELLASAKGLLVLSPVVAAGALGLLLLARRGFRAEAVVAGSVVAAYFIWNAGLTGPFGGPFGGDSPGPRYLVPALPFLAPGLALAFRAAFVPTALLAAISVLMLTTATATRPMLDGFDTSTWFDMAGRAEFTQSVVTLVGGPGGWLSVAPFLLGVGAAAGVAAAAGRPFHVGRREAIAAGGAVGAWALLATAAPPLLEDGRDTPALIALLGSVALAAVAIGRRPLVDGVVERARGSTALRLAQPLAIAAILAGAAAIAWHGATSIAPEDGYDGRAHVAFAEHLSATGDLPVEEESYEYATPPAYPWLAVQSQRLVDAAGEQARSLTGARGGAAGRLIWLGLVLVAVALLVAGSERRGVREAGVAVALPAAALAAVELVAAAADQRWRSGQLISVAATVVLLGATWLLARSVWPQRRLLPVAALAATVAVPLVLRLGVMFHPEMLFAALAVLAVAVTVRAGATGWPLRHALVLGVLLGLAALTRQTAAIVVLALAVGVVVAARARAVRFASVVAGTLLLVAGPWWLYQYDRYGNPIQSNLEREGYLLGEGQPRSFYVSLPVRDLVVHPYRPSFQNELLPMIHADIWSDWFGGQHGYWGESSSAGRFFASTQSVLGLAASLLALGGLFGFGVPALRRLARGDPPPRDLVAALSLLLFGLSWIVFVITLIRFPQTDGDPIKASYMLYLSPLFAIAAVRAGSWLWRRGRAWRILIPTWTLLYAASFVGFLATSWR